MYAQMGWKIREAQNVRNQKSYSVQTSIKLNRQRALRTYIKEISRVFGKSEI